MMRWLRRFVWLGVLAGGGYAGYRTWSRKQSLASAPPDYDPLARVLERAASEEPGSWRLGESVTLRGREAETRLATIAD